MASDRDFQNMLSDLYQKIVSLIGQSDNDPLVEQLLMTELSAERMRLEQFDFIDYGVAELGLSLQSQGRSIASAFFHFRTAAVREGYYKAYPYPLIADITAEDNQQAIMQKLNATPLRQNVRYDERPGEVGCCDEYEIGSYNLTFHFACEGSRILALSVRLRPQCK